MPPGRNSMRRQAATARRVALWAPPPSETVVGEASPSQHPAQSTSLISSPSQPAPSPSPPRPPPVPAGPPLAPPLLNQPSTVSSAVSSAASAASPALAESPASAESPAVADSSQPAARSIRCKSLYVRGEKNKRGVIVGTKTDNIVRLTGKKIVIKYSTFHNGPADQETCSLLARDIGSCVRASVPMLQGTFLELDLLDQDIISTYLTTNYEIGREDVKMWDWVSEKAENCYRQWKHKCKNHWKVYGDDIPLEFLKRPEQWKWLVTHFKDEKFQEELCTRNQGNRLMNPNQLNHHSGALALSYRASEHAEKGSAAPFVAAFLEAYGPDRNAKPVLDKVKRKLDEVMDTLSDGSAESIPIDDQVAVIEVGVGRNKGTRIRGVGAALRRDPRKRGGARQNNIDTQGEERIQKAMEEARLAKEEAQRAIEEAQRAIEEAQCAKEEAERSKEEFQRQQRDVMARLLALEAAAASKQVQPSSS